MNLHHYLFTFTETQGTNQRTAAITVAVPNPRVTAKTILIARKGAGVSTGAPLLSVSYLGQMTMDEFKNAVE